MPKINFEDLKTGAKFKEVGKTLHLNNTKPTSNAEQTLHLDNTKSKQVEKEQPKINYGNETKNNSQLAQGKAVQNDNTQQNNIQNGQDLNNLFNQINKEDKKLRKLNKSIKITHVRDICGCGC